MSEESQQAIVLHSMFNTTQGVGVRLDVSLHGQVRRLKTMEKENLKKGVL